MPDSPAHTAADLLLARLGIALVPPSAGPSPENQVTAVELELAELGYVLSTRLRDRLSQSSPEALSAFRNRSLNILSGQAGGGVRHQPLFRNFPNGIPSDTLDLWWSKVLVHFLQADVQPCLFCRRNGTTHVLDPCQHVVCDRCFDGANYSACPVCEHHVDQSSPFFLPPIPAYPQRNETVRFKLLDLGADLATEASALFTSLCQRKQALSPMDRNTLEVLVNEFKTNVLSWLPAAIPVRENVATVFGTLLRTGDPAIVLEHARKYITTATDVLRLIAVLSGTDGSLIRETVLKTIEKTESQSRFWGNIAKIIGAPQLPFGPARTTTVVVPIRVNRFKMAKLPRALRRSLLAILEEMDEQQLIEDMLRHQSYWVWAGEFLHPGEYASRFPKTARAFAVVRTKGPDGGPAPRFETWNSRLETARLAKDTDRMLEMLAGRPGEMARRVDLLLRSARNEAARNRVVTAVTSRLSSFATPVLLTLHAHLPTRHARAEVRAYWPKGRVATGALSADRRDLIPSTAIDPLVEAVDTELLRRFSSKPAFADCLIDRELQHIIVPFNERTSSAASVALPRGSRVEVEPSKLCRLFLHWCQPPGGRSTDLDLSVAFYDDEWRYVGVCSYYQLRLTAPTGADIARSSGDLQDAPYPDGASEFVDINREQALNAGFRYAVMVVNAYRGLPFSALDRGFAGLMLRDHEGGPHFDARTVQWKFTLQGENGVFMPLVFDMRELAIHWLDVQAKGEFEMNNVETSRRVIARICPRLMSYFKSGARASMWDLGLLHAAARCQGVTIREQGEAVAQLVREPGESASTFHRRLVASCDGQIGATRPSVPEDIPILAILYRGDCNLADGSTAYALFRERIANPMAASDLLS